MAEQGFTLTCPSFREGALIPSIHTCDGDNVSPALEWMHAPRGTRSFVLIVEDLDAQSNLVTHWVLYDIPVSVSTLRRRFPDTGIPGKNDFQYDGYKGPCPPRSRNGHRYVFTLYALNIDSLQLPAGTRRDQVEQAMEGRVLDYTELMGRYKRAQAGRP